MAGDSASLAGAALVTGAARGIGRATALRLAALGADVALVDLDAAPLAAVAREVEAAGRWAAVFAADAGEVDDLARLFDAVEAALGPVRTLVNNAGALEVAPLADLTPAAWDRLMRLNARGLFFWTQAGGRRMVANGGGAIVNVASIAGRGGRPLLAHYAASKAAVISVTRSAALAFAPSVRVNCVCPGNIDTPMWEQLDRDLGARQGLPPGETRRRIVERVPLGRAGTPDEVADVIAFFASDQARFVTGQALNVCGGTQMD
jgi:NAD(P)-dependent dehydrogenase (short-subunit alcohol dehydrogenase family)